MTHQLRVLAIITEDLQGEQRSPCYRHKIEEPRMLTPQGCSFKRSNATLVNFPEGLSRSAF